ncbi:unnamed protein product [Onchocerca flexuosa]|uniref:DUF19 domain-containing protein n=1 Tax=Onchocerca flexuosa TaxID=387005 RepID=A0A183HHJ3_9BILA|nr:unnamed protein product [Onchocerca flexuosa]
MVLPNSCRKDMNFVRQYAMEHGNELNLCRHALLSCPKSFCNINICKTVEEDNAKLLVFEGKYFATLIILSCSRLLTSLKGKKTVDEDCWTRALELEDELRLTTEVCSTDN